MKKSNQNSTSINRANQNGVKKVKVIGKIDLDSTSKKSEELHPILKEKTADFYNNRQPIDHSKYTEVFKDKVMTISEDDEKIYISTHWLGRIKDSYFTINGAKGKSKFLRHGWIWKNNLEDLPIEALKLFLQEKKTDMESFLLDWKKAEVDTNYYNTMEEATGLESWEL
ncbi:MAG: hypothetical protein PF542_05610 [Nanoarchaeota archaeon]|jgi:hypothetical protein|nr:hypothetical protein [Nanoarchaeota archaeon]